MPLRCIRRGILQKSLMQIENINAPIILMENIIASMAVRDFCAIQGDKARQRRATLGSVARLPPVAAIGSLRYKRCKRQRSSAPIEQAGYKSTP